MCGELQTDGRYGNLPHNPEGITAYKESGWYYIGSDVLHNNNEIQAISMYCNVQFSEKIPSQSKFGGSLHG